MLPIKNIKGSRVSALRSKARLRRANEANRDRKVALMRSDESCVEFRPTLAAVDQAQGCVPGALRHALGDIYNAFP
ncbi:MAG TPA: hypothetical protein DEH25_02420 [Chloroflexi bacterium]|nr:hypothetical protein [Chloroflexota bacterium]HBY08680.1 hypothetical protein [Chloroflexota bacterium]